MCVCVCVLQLGLWPKHFNRYGTGRERGELKRKNYLAKQFKNSLQKKKIIKRTLTKLQQEQVCEGNLVKYSVDGYKPLMESCVSG